MQKLNPKILIVFFIQNLFSTVYIIPLWLIAVGVFGKVWNPLPGLLPKIQIVLLLYGAAVVYLIFLFMGSYFWAWLTYSCYSYATEHDGLHIYSGVLLKKHIIIPYNFIENVEIYANPFVVRFLGLFYLHIKTRATQTNKGVINRPSDIKLPGITLDVVKDLKGQLINASHILTQSPRKYFDPATGTYH
jgi:membrane protein YdbS with pleckstrin-like domain